MHTYYNSADPACKQPFGAVTAGTEAGRVDYSLGGQLLASYPVYIGQSVERIDYRWCLEQLWKWYCGKS